MTRKMLGLVVVLLFLAAVVLAATKESGTTTLKDVQPAGTTDKKHKKQQFDLSFTSTSHDYTCRTNENEKVKATDYVVGSTITYKINGNKGEVKSTANGKNIKCTLVRVAVSPPTPQ
jgi:curli biogenesis system outer membrane secretion channel CsgG